MHIATFIFDGIISPPTAYNFIINILPIAVLSQWPVSREIIQINPVIILIRKRGVFSLMIGRREARKHLVRNDSHRQLRIGAGDIGVAGNGGNYDTILTSRNIPAKRIGVNIKRRCASAENYRGKCFFCYSHFIALIVEAIRIIRFKNQIGRRVFSQQITTICLIIKPITFVWVVHTDGGNRGYAIAIYANALCAAHDSVGRVVNIDTNVKRHRCASAIYFSQNIKIPCGSDRHLLRI